MKSKEQKQAKTAKPERPVEQTLCPHGNHFCLACENCGRPDPRRQYEAERERNP